MPYQPSSEEAVTGMILVIDLGTQSFRATVVDRDGRRVSEYSCPIDTDRDGLIAEQDPRQWRDALRAALRTIDKKSIRAVTASATLSGIVCLDPSGEVLRPAILYSDRRPAGQLPAIESGEEYQRSGWRAYSGDFLPQLTYIRDREPPTYEAAKYLLDATGYLNYLLTGQATLDRYTTFTCYADPTKATMPELGVASDKLGRIVWPGEAIGPAVGFEEAMVFSVSYDSAAAYLGSCLARAGDALDISGTVTSFGVLTENRLVDPERRIFSIPYGDRWLVRGSTAMSGGVLEWARHALLGLTFEEFDHAVRDSPPGANGVTFLPYLAGARTPVWEPSASGVFSGLSAQTTKPDLARAVYEGLCYSLQHIVATIESCGAPVGSIQLGGGLSRNSLLNQMKADVTGRPVRPQVDTEVTTLGSASIAARALGWLPAHDSFCALGEIFSPDRARHHEYLRAFDRYQDLVRRLY